MEEQLAWMWKVIALIIGINATCFLFLVKRLNELSDHIDTSVKFSEKLNQLIDDVHQIKVCLIGDLEKKGLLTKHKELEVTVERIAEEVGT